jgi:hypothetical protein
MIAGHFIDAAQMQIVRFLALGARFFIAFSIGVREPGALPLM